MEINGAETTSHVETLLYTEYTVVRFMASAPHTKMDTYKKQDGSEQGFQVIVPSTIPGRESVAVAEMMAQGWRPLGGVAVRIAGTSVEGGYSGASWLYQAMVR